MGVAVGGDWRIFSDVEVVLSVFINFIHSIVITFVTGSHHVGCHFFHALLVHRLEVVVVVGVVSGQVFLIDLGYLGTSQQSTLL